MNDLIPSTLFRTKEKGSLNLNIEVLNVQHVSFVTHPQDIAWNPLMSRAGAYFSPSEVKSFGWY